MKQYRIIKQGERYVVQKRGTFLKKWRQHDYWFGLESAEKQYDALIEGDNFDVIKKVHGRSNLP